MNFLTICISASQSIGKNNSTQNKTTHETYLSQGPWARAGVLFHEIVFHGLSFSCVLILCYISCMGTTLLFVCLFFVFLFDICSYKIKNIGNEEYNVQQKMYSACHAHF